MMRDLGQPGLGALSNVQAKAILGVGHRDAERLAKLTSRVDAEAIKRDPKTDTQHELFSSLPEQWEQWVLALPTGSSGDGGEPGWPGGVVENDDHSGLYCH